MKYRTVTLFNGKRFQVPSGIQRIDHRATHGWQLRFAGTKLFSDHSSDGSGARASLNAATRELLERMAHLPAPTRLQRQAYANKTTQLPAGISGPVIRLRAGTTVRTCSLSVALPRFGQTQKRASVYVGTENTFTQERYELALARAIQMRQQAEAAYQRAANKAQRAEAAALLSKQPAAPKASPAKKPAAGKRG